MSRRKKAYQGRKIGSQLLATLESEARKKVGYLQVKTVAEGSNKDYDRTNDFYRGLGFKKLEIFPQLWNPQNPCQILMSAIL
ncbi:acetyltransferase [Streptococcus pneumoniae]|uniref:Acetyltransferase n=1 Tax=Streptococcus pneumoniae TaxID=1313 RepID=A0A4J2E2U1_STREE|nr:acetyltransferase [Streptococcus pneumoniae]CZD84139.1 acetyltransferase [Streptococcus pneumoniae]VIP86275.1 acetyltransferase [Streptococcus pneumoniae]VIR33816.1 acetyltransferase [Streptococcus pneumoniae]VIU77425.1 acetyltransferase [Streptococcus pneumoniae]